MLIYIPAFLITFVCGFYAENFKNKFQISKKRRDFAVFLILVLVIFLALFFVSGFRYGIAYDYFFTDNRVLNAIREGMSEGFNEFFTNAIAKFLIINLGLPNSAYFILFSLLSVSCYVIAIFINRKNSYLLQIFILIFYSIFFNSINQVRSGAAIALGILAFSIVYNYRNVYTIILAYILCLLGTLIHYSEVINLVVLTLFLLIMQFGHKIKMKTILTTMIILVAITPILFLLLKYTIEYIPILNNYAYFFDPNFDATGTPLMKFLSGFFTYIIPMVNLVFFLLNFKDNEESFMKFVGIIIFINFVFLTFGVLTNSMLLSDRLKSMLYVFELFIIPYIYKNLRSRNQQILYISSIGVIMIIITICSLSPSLAYPYRSIFFKGHYIY